jgi:peptidoglycan/LPS O-acetylase OafA/YrhL
MDRKAGGYVEEVDALRCFAMVAVMMSHAGLLPIGWAGVWLFFVISGFAITRSLIADAASGAGAGRVILMFFQKRGLRILPLYLFYLGVVAIYSLAMDLPGFWSTVPYLATFTYNLAIAFGSPAVSAPGVVHLWSISGEEQFYLLFPLLFMFLSRRWFLIAMLALLVASPVLRWVLGAYHHPGDASAAAAAVKFFTPAHFDAFAAGALIAVTTSGRALSRRQGYLALLSGVGALLLYVAAYVVLQSRAAGHIGVAAFADVVSGTIVGQHREVFGYTAVWLASAGLLVGILARLPALIALCRPRIFRWVGRISYGGYVYHGFVIELLTRLLPGSNTGSVFGRVGFLVVMAGLSIAVAAASYRWIERPFLKLKPQRLPPGTSADQKQTPVGRAATRTS